MAICPEGKEWRRSYNRTSKSGKKIHVKGECVMKTGVFPRYSGKKVRESKEKEQREAMRISRNKGNVPRSCSKGQIMRSPYIRKSYTRLNGSRVKASVVPPSCITNRGKPGKGPKLITLDPEDHILSEHGYKNIKNMSRTQRRSALSKTIKSVGKEHRDPKLGYLYAIKSLTARSTLLKNNSPRNSKLMKENQKWVSKKYEEYKKKSPNKK